MLLVLLSLYLLLPTLAARPLVGSLGLRSELLSVSASWFVGQGVALVATLSIACLIGRSVGDVLLISSAATIGAAGALALWPKRSARSSAMSGGSSTASLLLVVFAAAAAYAIYAPHLWMEDGWIMRSHVYWDFILHYPLVQTFAYGDNFPPQHEAFAGLPLTYHYFFDLLCAVYARLGLDLVGGVNLASMASMFFLLTMLGGLGEEIAGSTLSGWLAAIMSITSGSFRFLFDLERARDQGLVAALSLPFSESTHPYTFGFLDGNPYGYNGTMHNVFYFIAERQLVFGSGLLLTALLAIYRLPRIRPASAMILGGALGLCFQWHLYVTALIGASLAVCLLGDGRRSTLSCIFGYFAVCFGHYAYFSSIASNPEWFLPSVTSVPRLDFQFTTNSNYGPSIGNAAAYWVFAYGVKPIVALAGFGVMMSRDKRWAFVIASIVVPAFVMINTVQLSPISIYDNHKWLKPMNLLVDLAAGTAIASFLAREGSRVARIFAAGACSAALCLSGAIELLPFLFPKHVLRENAYPSEMMHALRMHTPPRSVILARDALDVLLAGRRVFLEFSGDTDPGYRPYFSFGLNKAPREETIYRIYAAYGRRSLCDAVNREGIDYIEFTLEMQKLPVYRIVMSWPGFETFSERLGIPLRYVSFSPCREQ